MSLKVRRSELKDLDAIAKCFLDGRAHMRAEGNVTQWDGVYPDADDAREDIARGIGYSVVQTAEEDSAACAENRAAAGEEPEEEVVAYFALIIGPDPTYSYIEDGAWLDDEKPYGTIHRISSRSGVHGVLEAALAYAFSVIDNVRIDTHKDNQTMLHLMDKFGFTRCGIIYVEDGTPREAFQKLK